MKIILATNNQNKIKEIREILERLGIEVFPLDHIEGQPPQIVEDGKTFLANARKKALAIAEWAGMPALADDSGLIVDALGGEPGVVSSRYAGIEGGSVANNNLLLEKMEKVPDGQRNARFLCVICLATPSGRTWETDGTVEGWITREKRGTGGFGYDPVFLYKPAGMTFAQMGSREKNTVSHRARAITAMAKRITDIQEELEKLS